MESAGNRRWRPIRIFRDKKLFWRRLKKRSEKMSHRLILLNILIFIFGFNVILGQSKSCPSPSIEISPDDKRYNELTNQGFDYLNKSHGSVVFIALAIKNFSDALEENPRDLNGYLALGQTYMKVSSFLDAISVLESALIIFPEEGRLNYLLAECYDALQDKRLARHFAKRSIENFEKSRDTKKYLQAANLLRKVLN